MKSHDPAGEAAGIEPKRRGRLAVFLGAAPGVGKTYAMLDEAQRRRARGTDVVIALVETHGRKGTGALMEGLEVIPRQRLRYRDREFTEMDLAAVLRRAPQVALVDELAHTNVPGAGNEKRWQDVEEMLAAGIDVVTTVNIQHLESLNDDIAAITGVRQRETVPDAIVRSADQINLVDLSPQALRRRLAHGNIYRADQIDASLTSYFRVGNLTALRELALLWLADRVDAALTDYRKTNRIESPWPIRERVVVAVPGGKEGETLIRRGAKIAQRSAGSELLAVHVLAADGLATVAPAAIASQRRLVESLGGTMHTVVGEDVASAVIDFATGVNATLIVIGVSRHSRFREVLTESVGVEVARQAGAIDVHLVAHERARGQGRSRRRWFALPLHRQIAGFIVALAGPALISAILLSGARSLALSTDVLLYLTVTVGVALIGGLWPALACSVISFLALNFLFTPPTGMLAVASPDNLLALLIFIVVAAGVASVVDLSARRSQQALHARAEATTLAELSKAVLSGMDTAQAVVNRLRETFALASVSLLERSDEHSQWRVIAFAGGHPVSDPDKAENVTTIDPNRILTMCGKVLAANDRRIMDAFAAQAGLVLEYRRLREQAAQAAVLERAEETRTAILQALSHDLRTPLAVIRTSVDTLHAPDLELSPQDTAELTETIESSTTALEHLMDNLLDLSRLQTGAVQPIIRRVSLDEVVPLALQGVPRGRVKLRMPESLPLVWTDPGMLERAVANVVSNALRYAPADQPIVVDAVPGPEVVELRIVDTGVGISEEAKERMFEPFQRLGDSAPGGLGLGLAVTKALCGVLGIGIEAEDTPGGGLTMSLTIPRRRPT